MPDEPEEGFVFRDRRRFTTESTVETPKPVAVEPVAPPELPTFMATPEEEVAESEEFGEFAQDGYDGEPNGPLPDVFSVLAIFLQELRSLAYLRMGLIANPGTGQIERDLFQAKVAIDTVGFLASQLEPVIAPEERLPLRAMVSDLQMNFIEQTKQNG